MRVASAEPDPGPAESIARRGCIPRGIVGSTVHGPANPRIDDRDEMGVCVEPPEHIAGLRAFEHWVFRTQPEGAPSGPGDLDLTIYGLRKYASHCRPRSLSAPACWTCAETPPRRIPSGPAAILGGMDDRSHDPSEEFESFARTSLAPLVAVFVRVIHDAALAYDLATETLAGARWRWVSPHATGDDRFAWLIELGGAVLADAAQRRRVPSVERRRRAGGPAQQTLTISDQQEIARIAEAQLELTEAARDVVERLSRSSPPLHILREIALSGLLDAEELRDRGRDRERHGS